MPLAPGEAVQCLLVTRNVGGWHSELLTLWVLGFRGFGFWVSGLGGV